MQERRILVGLTYYKPNISGLTVYVERLVENLQSSNFRIQILTSEYTKTKKENNVIRVKGFRLGKGFVMPLYPIIAVREVLRSEIVNCHLPSIESFWSCLWAKIFNKKLVITYHCSFESGSRVIDKIINTIDQIVLSWADVIVVNSFDYVKRIGIYDKYQIKMEEIYPPINVSSIKYQVSRIKRKTKTIGYLGRISREKNLEVLIKAMEYLPGNYELLMAGGRNAVGEDEYRKKIEQMIKGKKQIKDLGKIKNQNQLFEKIDCLVLPSISRLESFGMVSAEAINAGIPVVCSDIEGIRVPVVISGFGELFDPRDPKDLAEKIQLAVSKKYQRKIIFSIDDTVKKYAKIFN